MRALIGHTDRVRSVAFSPDGNKIASGSWDDTIRLWDTNTGEQLQTLTGHTDDVNSVAFSPDGNTIASASDDYTIRLWNAHTGEQLQTLTGHTSPSYSVAFSPDGNTIASGSWDGTVLLWEHTPTVVEPEKIVEDVNGDGTVNIQDLVLVAGRLGQSGANSADVNGDGIVNIQDLVLVAGALGTSAAAPSLHLQSLDTLTAADVKQWLSEAQQLEMTDAKSLQGILFLQQLLEALTPKKTALLANFPNPFNPETWIPYRLAEDAFVTLTIYDGSGQVVRTLDVGHQIAAFYESRSKAIYWDGRNEFGEQVASGVYFYHLSAGNYSATRKMLILK